MRLGPWRGMETRFRGVDEWRGGDPESVLGGCGGM